MAACISNSLVLLGCLLSLKKYLGLLYSDAISTVVEYARPWICGCSAGASGSLCDRLRSTVVGTLAANEPCGWPRSCGWGAPRDDPRDGLREVREALWLRRPPELLRERREDSSDSGSLCPELANGREERGEEGLENDSVDSVPNTSSGGTGGTAGPAAGSSGSTSGAAGTSGGTKTP